MNFIINASIYPYNSKIRKKKIPCAGKIYQIMLTECMSVDQKRTGSRHKLCKAKGRPHFPARRAGCVQPWLLITLHAPAQKRHTIT